MSQTNNTFFFSQEILINNFGQILFKKRFLYNTSSQFFRFI